MPVLANPRSSTRRISDLFHPIEKPRVSASEYSESNRASKHVTLLSKFREKPREQYRLGGGISSSAGICSPDWLVY